MPQMKIFSASVLWTQVALFVVGTAYVCWAFSLVIAAGAGLVPGFEPIQLRRLIAYLAPYLVLPVSFTLSLFLHSFRKYATATCFPLILMASAFIGGRIYLMAVPDPIIENFGDRRAPYPGFLFLSPEGVPAGFKETAHHYTKQEYNVRFTKMLDGKRIDLEIMESPITQFLHDQGTLVQEFTYQDILGQVYTSHHKRTGTTTLNLIWLSPPRQRISIYLEQMPPADSSPEDLIKILESMKLAE
jgi:hypothetical protein